MEPSNKNPIGSRVAGALIVIVTVVALVAGQDGYGTYRPPISLADAVEQALANDPLTRASESRLRIADLKLQQARVGKRPWVQFSQTATAGNDPVFVFGSLLAQGRFRAPNLALDRLNSPNTLFNLRSAVDVRWPLFDQHQNRWRVAEARVARSRTELQAEAVRQRLRFDVIRTFYGLMLSREREGVYREAVRAAEANCKKTRDMADVGFTTQADYLSAEVELARVTQQKLEAQGDLVISTASLNLLIGDGPGVERRLAGDLQERYFPPLESADLIRTALVERPDYLAAEMSVTSGRLQARAARDMRLPRVDAFANAGYSSPYITGGSADYTVGLSLKYDVFDAARKARIAEAAEAETLAAAEKDVLANQITADVIKAFQDYQTAGSRIQVSIKSIAQAEEALRIVQDRYKFGLATFNEVLRSEAAVVSAKFGLLQARHDHLVGYASLLLATGQLRDVRVFD